VVLVERPLVGIQVIDKWDEGRIVDAVIAEQVARVCPVFLFDMSVVVFFVGAGASETNRFFPVSEVAHEVVVEKFGTIVAVKAE